MIKVEIKKVENQENIETPLQTLHINGKNVGYTRSDINDKDYILYANSKFVNIFLDYSFEEILTKISLIEIPQNLVSFKKYDWLKESPTLLFQKPQKSYSHNFNTGYLTFFPDTKNWNKFFSINNLTDRIDVFCKNETDIDLESDPKYGIGNSFLIKFIIKNKKSKLRDFQEYMLSKSDEIISLAIESLLSDANDNSLNIPFNFPESIKTSCEQYLIYFSQFLADLGIKATSNIQSTDKETTLFSVIPDDPNVALSEIRDALNIYLNLPEQDNFANQAIVQNNIAVQQLQSNVFHLKSQLLLIKATLEAKDATIQSLRLTNFQQKKLIDCYEQENKNKEELAGGLVTIDQYEGKGFKINLAELFRRLKRTLKND